MPFTCLSVAIHPWRKFIPFYFISLCLVLLVVIPARAQQVPAQARLQQIEQQLQALAVTTLPGLNEDASLSVSKAPIQDVMRGIAATHSLNISVDPSMTELISYNLTNVKVHSLLMFLIKEYQLDVRTVGNIISISKYVPPAVVKPPVVSKKLKLEYNASTGRLTSDLANDSLSAFAKQATQLTRKNIVLAPGIGHKLISGYIQDMPLPDALDKIAYSNNLKLTKTDDNTFILQAADEVAAGGRTTASRPRVPGQSNSDLRIEIKQGENSQQLVTVEASNVPIAELLNEVSDRAGLNYVLFSSLQGNTTLHLSQVPYDNFIAFLLQGTTHTYRVSEGIYLIGDRNLEGFRSTQVVRMQYRPVEKLDEIIPGELKKGVEIKLFKELNSVILSGGAPQIQEITNFLKAIDEPVVNVLIEVLVVELRKGKSIQTGLKAFLGDSTVQTKGQVLGGVNMTVGSESINKILEKADATGLVNIGRVTPSFYVTLQALEQNNYLDLRSTPQLATLNGHEANLKIGQSVYYLEETQNIVGGVTPITSVSQQFKQVSANLNIKINPWVSGDEHITLNIQAEFSDFVPPAIPGAPPGNATREFNSMIRVKNEEMIMLGGLEEVSKTEAGSGVPLLSRIPVLKYLFSSRSKAKNDNKLLVFIKPTLLY